MTEEEKKKILIPPTISVRAFAEKADLPVTNIIAELMKNGVMATMNENIDADTASIIGENLGLEIEVESVSDTEASASASQSEQLEQLLDDTATTMESRPPVIVVMGHVDHGKTKLLDAIRETHITEGEAGGITQHIGAYQVTRNNRLITFIDTPGHEAFTAMRSRGARVADIAILVVAADEGVKPQTKEAYEIIKKSSLPFVVAVNKIDKPEANPEKVLRELSELGILTEKWGGNIQAVEVSATTKQGIGNLLEIILLVTDIEKKEIRANPNRAAVGTVIESHVDKGEGPVATVVVQTGTLKLGDFIQAGDVTGKIKNMRDWATKPIKEAPPSTPVRILGLEESPDVGDVLTVVEKEHVRKEKKKRRYRPSVSPSQTVAQKTARAEDEEEKKEDHKAVTVVLKADTLSSIEAIVESVQKFRSDEVDIQFVRKSLGNITEADVLLASTSDALLMGFHVQPTSSAEEVARGHHIEITTYDIIYDLVDVVKNAVEELLSPEIVREEIGTGKILAVFKREKTAMIVGGKVENGHIAKGAIATIKRKGEVIGEGTIATLQQDKKAAAEVKAGNEFGIRIEGMTDIEAGDTLAAVMVSKRVRKIEE